MNLVLLGSRCSPYIALVYEVCNNPGQYLHASLCMWIGPLPPQSEVEAPISLQASEEWCYRCLAYVLDGKHTQVQKYLGKYTIGPTLRAQNPSAIFHLSMSNLTGSSPQPYFSFRLQII